LLEDDLKIRIERERIALALVAHNDISMRTQSERFKRPRGELAGERAAHSTFRLHENEQAGRTAKIQIAQRLAALPHCSERANGVPWL
jgi:hypothetical protein